ncbi:hypothetical protein AGMMS50262_00010 [Bacteroidia bacterium]|nr:hypothetical protein AGMMS50262_00010 [Bacteroidia bacterium]
MENSQKIRLSDLSEETIAGNWEKLSSAEYNPAIADCLDLREQLKLCDWGYYQLVKTIADKFYGTAYPNESVLFQSFILTQSGEGGTGMGGSAPNSFHASRINLA